MPSGPNVEVNRRAEGTSELNHRLGLVRRRRSFGLRYRWS